MPLHIIVSGAPASGKGTQCQNLKDRYNLVHISTGDALREEQRKRSTVGLEAEKYMTSGGLVPDEMVVEIVVNAIKAVPAGKGWLLDGFPRTANQAQQMNKLGIVPDVVFLLEVPDEVLVKRACSRVYNPRTKETFNLNNLPPNMTEAEKKELMVRKDDTPESMQNRLKMYHGQVKDVVAFFRNVQRVDGNRAPNTIAADLYAYLDDMDSARWRSWLLSPAVKYALFGLFTSASLASKYLLQQRRKGAAGAAAGNGSSSGGKVVARGNL